MKVCKKCNQPVNNGQNFCSFCNSDEIAEIKAPVNINSDLKKQKKRKVIKIILIIAIIWIGLNLFFILIAGITSENADTTANNDTLQVQTTVSDNEYNANETVIGEELDETALDIAYQENCQYGYTCEKVEIRDKDGFGRFIIYHRAVNVNGNVDMGFDFVAVSKNGNYYTNAFIDGNLNANGLNNFDYKNSADIKWGQPLSEMGIEGLK